jgi:hypothetical protein
MCRSRYDILNGPIYTGLFQKNALSFDLFFDTNIASKRFLFSHAGITSRWLSAVGKGNLDQTLQWMKTSLMEFCLDRTKDEVWSYLAHIGEERGGNSQSGSIIWADFFEHMDKSNWLDDENLIQVVGHTQLNYHPASVGARLYCLDCREPFYIDSEGVIRSWQTDDDIMTKYNILAI